LHKSRDFFIVPMANYLFTHYATGCKRYRPYGTRAKVYDSETVHCHTKQEKKTP